MKRNSLIIVLLVMIVNLLNGDISEFYKSGILKLSAGNEFCKEMEWDEIFFDTFKQMIVASDGSIFITNGRQNNIYKFNTQCFLEKTFGRTGRGPGDLTWPSELSILDNKYLVVRENDGFGRISLFNLDGIFIKIVKTRFPVFYCIGLSFNKIALLTSKPVKKNLSQHRVLIKDILTGSEKEVASFLISNRKLNLGSMHYSPGKFGGKVFLRKTSDNNLFVGFSRSDFISIYSPEGQLVKSFKLGISPVKVNGKMIEAYKHSILLNMKNDKSMKWLANRLKKADFSTAMPDFLPYYSNAMITDENHIWLVEFSNIESSRNTGIYAYSTIGKKIGRFKLDFGTFKKKNNSPIAFHDGCLYGLYEYKDSQDISLRIIKVQIGKNKIE